jgi:hypothetical protein
MWDHEERDLLPGMTTQARKYHEASVGAPSIVELDAQDRSRPLGECEPVVQWLVAEHAADLLHQLCRNARILSEN